MQNLFYASMPVVALLAAYIAYQQSKIAKDSLREKLFDRRFKIYDAYRAFSDKVFIGGIQSVNMDDKAKFFVASREARFLFDEVVMRDMTDFFAMVERGQAIEKNRELYPNASDELLTIRKSVREKGDKIDILFDPYLTLSINTRNPIIFQNNLSSRLKSWR